MSHHNAERVLFVLVTSACNLRCSYCFLRDKRWRTLGWPALRAALDWVLSAASQEARVVFSGGEPLLALPMIARAVEYLDSRRRPDLTLHYEILTNGILLGQKQTAFLAEHDFRIGLSFDGVRRAQNLRGRGTFDTLEQAIARLRQEWPCLFEHRLEIAMTLCRENVTTLADSVSYFLKTGVSAINLSAAMTTDARWSSRDSVELDGQFARMYQDSVGHYERTGQVPLTLFLKTSPDRPRRSVPDAPCRIGAGHALAVDATGRAFACPLFAAGYHRPGSPLLDAAARVVDLGQADKPGLTRRLEALPPKIGATRLFTARREKYSSWRRCGECRYLDRCRVCPVAVGLAAGNADPDHVPDFQCAFSRTSLKYRDRFPCQREPAEGHV